MDEWVNVIINSIKHNGILIGLALTATFAQTASVERPSVNRLLISLPMSFFVVWMTWLGVGHLDVGDKMQIFWTGIAAFGAPWILRGINTILRQFMESPIDFLMKLKELLRRK